MRICVYSHPMVITFLKKYLLLPTNHEFHACIDISKCLMSLGYVKSSVRVNFSLHPPYNFMFLYSREEVVEVETSRLEKILEEELELDEEIITVEVHR